MRDVKGLISCQSAGLDSVLAHRDEHLIWIVSQWEGGGKRTSVPAITIELGNCETRYKQMQTKQCTLN
jgi:hypothetical protein